MPKAEDHFYSVDCSRLIKRAGLKQSPGDRMKVPGLATAINEILKYDPHNLYAEK